MVGGALSHCLHSYADFYAQSDANVHAHSDVHA
jgi:hypothetical protein